ncbi:hypothetical protein ACN4EE_03625 [Geminocystis sp. CENA526]|uniref:hypothetical protein n=1 Tax=Geminocystis sp. CENA526 TaxID=1355871 RepID=UPI003D6DC02B
MNDYIKFDRANNYIISNLIKQEILKIYNLSNLNFAIELSKNEQEFVYKTPVCLQLAKIAQKSPLFIAENIVNRLTSSNFIEYFLVRISGNGWLEFVLLDRTLNHWLNQFYPLNLLILYSTKEEKSQVSFKHIYPHTRCCSILKSAHRDNIISLDNLDLKVNQWRIKTPSLIDYQQLFNGHSYERKLIKELIIISEKINKNKINYHHALNNLSQRILEFESFTRIWGETLQQNISLSQARLGLIALSLHYYQNIFQAEFNQELPQEID